MTQQIVVSGGAGFWAGDEGVALDRFVFELTGRARPRVCYLATAAGDAAEFIAGFYEGLGPYCEPTHLPLFLPPFRDPSDTLLAQDVIYVSGGSTSNMLAVWRLHGIDVLLRRALESGTILCGSSAGGICWFESGLSDSLSFDGSLHPLTNGLGFLPGSHAPHFDAPDRRERFVEEIEAGRLPDGLGLDDFAAAHFIDGVLTDLVATRPETTGHLLRAGDRGVQDETLAARRL